MPSSRLDLSWSLTVSNQPSYLRLITDCKGVSLLAALNPNVTLQPDLWTSAQQPLREGMQLDTIGLPSISLCTLQWVHFLPSPLQGGNRVSNADLDVAIEPAQRFSQVGLFWIYQAAFPSLSSPPKDCVNCIQSAARTMGFALPYVSDNRG